MGWIRQCSGDCSKCAGPYHFWGKTKSNQPDWSGDRRNANRTGRVADVKDWVQSGGEHHQFWWGNRNIESSRCATVQAYSDEFSGPEKPSARTNLKFSGPEKPSARTNLNRRKLGECSDQSRKLESRKADVGRGHCCPNS